MVWGARAPLNHTPKVRAVFRRPAAGRNVFLGWFYDPNFIPAAAQAPLVLE